MLIRIIFGAALVIFGLLAYQQFSQKATIDHLYEAHSDFVLGKQNAKFTIIEFFDYNSKWSRRTYPMILQLISKYPEIRVILKEYPGITEESEKISRFALASRRMGRYKEVHNALMSLSGPINDLRLRSVADQLGMNYDELMAIGNTEEITRQIDENRQAAFFLGIEAAPSFVVHGEVIAGGGMNVQDFRRIITAKEKNRR